IAFAAFAAFAAAPAGAQSRARRALAIEDYYRVKTVGSVGLSPEGRWVAFAVTTRVEDTNGSTAEVWLAPFDGSTAARRVSANGVNSTGPSWTEDGKLRF